MSRASFPTLKQLRYFVALVDANHFGRAAKACFVSQSAFSAAIKELEAVLNIGLVDRTNRRVTITAAGREVAGRAREILHETDALKEFAQSRSGKMAGPLRLGVIPTIAPFLLPRVLPKLRREFPDLDVHLQEGTTESVHQLLLAGELDLILIALPYDLRGVQTLKLFKDPFLLACQRNTRLLDPGNYRPEKLPDESVLLLEDGHCMRGHALDACRLRHTEKVHRYAAASLLTLVEMVNADLGITFLPQMAKGSALLDNTGLQLVPLDRLSYREIGFAWRRGSARAGEFRELARCFKPDPTS